MHNPGARIVAALDRAEPAVWVLVAQARGSAPREAGASMLVTATHCEGTIGGGHLELKATEVARERLAAGTTLATRRHFPLGPALGQCCGGAVDILLIPVCEAGRADWLRLQAAGVTGGAFRWTVGLDTGDTAEVALAFSPWHIWVFGAGHVGRALVDVLATLPCNITWVDSRDAQFPEHTAENVHLLASDDPAAETRAVPSGADVLVMTHSHALDFDIVLPLARRDDLGMLGVIGSGTKAATFRRRLQQRGLDAAAQARMHCPIGRAPMDSDDAALRKHPGVIAVQVAAALIERHQLASASAVLTGLHVENRG